MVNAVCFNLNVFNTEVLNRILRETGARMRGRLGDEAQVNCLQSFADGTMFYAFCWKDEIQRDKIIDCGKDIEQFIYVNSEYGKQHNERTNR